MSHSRLRRSMSCIAAGLLIVGPVAVFFGGDLVDWHPHKIVVVILATLCIAGIVWLFDEIRDIRAEQKLASVNPFMAASPSPQQEPKNETSAEANELLIRRSVGTMIEAKAIMDFESDRASRLEVTITSVADNLTPHGRAIEMAVNAALSKLFLLWDHEDRRRQQGSRVTSPEQAADLAGELFKHLEQSDKWTRIELVLHRRI
jgi:hypothetical protein